MQAEGRDDRGGPGTKRGARRLKKGTRINLQKMQNKSDKGTKRTEAATVIRKFQLLGGRVPDRGNSDTE